MVCEILTRIKKIIHHMHISRACENCAPRHDRVVVVVVVVIHGACPFPVVGSPNVVIMSLS